MAGDWVAMRADLERDPAVVHIAAKLKCSRREAIGHLHAAWSFFDAVSRDGHARGVTGATLDDLVRCDGLAAAMASTPEAPWLIFGEDGHVIMPNYDVWLSQSGKRRLLAAKRQRDKRARDAEVPVTLASRTGRDILVTTGQERTEEIQQHHAPSGAGGSDLSVSFPEGWTDTLNGDPPRGLEEYMGDVIVGWKPDARVLCETPSSVRELRRLVEVDGRNPDQIRALLLWLFDGGYQPRGDFDWRPNVTSGKSLRNAWDKLDTLYCARAGANGHREP